MADEVISVLDIREMRESFLDDEISEAMAGCPCNPSACQGNGCTVGGRYDPVTDTLKETPVSGAIADPWKSIDVIRACELADGVRHICVLVGVCVRTRRYVDYYLWCQPLSENARRFSPDHSEMNQDAIVAFYADEDGVNCIACFVR